MDHEQILKTGWLRIAEEYAAEDNPNRKELLVLESDTILDSYNRLLGELALKEIADK